MKIATSCIACAGLRLRHRPAVLMPFIAARVFGWESVEITDDWGLRDLPPGRAHAICRTVMCDDCGALFLDMRFDDDEMNALYDTYRGADYCDMRERFEPGYRARNQSLNAGTAYVEEVERFIAPHLASSRPRVLDWGGGSGINSPFRGRAACLDIYDISSGPLAEGARWRTRSQIERGDYDLVVLANVLEHVPDPRGLLNEVAQVMAPGTVAYIEVPHEDVIRLVDDSEDRLIAKQHWHEHVNFFTETALHAVIRAAGLEVLDLASKPVVVLGADRCILSVMARRLRAEERGAPLMTA